MLTALQFDDLLIPAISSLPDIEEKHTNATHDLTVVSTTSVQITFLHIVDQLKDILKQFECEHLLKLCYQLKASETHSIDLFPNSILDKYETTTSVLCVVFSFITWSDHSILRELISYSSKATKLLDEFSAKLDYSEVVASYPIPHLTSDMLPTDPTSSHTVLAVRCDQELYNCTLQYLFDIRSLVVDKCDITLHCLQLIAVRPNPTIIYWNIPKCVIDLISSKVPEQRDQLYSRGVLEVSLYPNTLLATSDDVRIGSLAFLPENKTSFQKVYFIAVQYLVFIFPYIILTILL